MKWISIGHRINIPVLYAWNGKVWHVHRPETFLLKYSHNWHCLILFVIGRQHYHEMPQNTFLHYNCLIFHFTSHGWACDLEDRWWVWFRSALHHSSLRRRYPTRRWCPSATAAGYSRVGHQMLAPSSVSSLADTTEIINIVSQLLYIVCANL